MAEPGGGPAGGEERLPRRSFWRYVSSRQLLSVAMMLACLLAVVALRRSCAQGVGNLFQGLAPLPADAGAPPAPR